MRNKDTIKSNFNIDLNQLSKQLDNVGSDEIGYIPN
jgi:tryptophanase